MPPTTPMRRASDHRPLDIEGMIAEENDPRQRSFLIVLNSINNSLLANTKTIQDVSSKLDDHLTRFEEHTDADAAELNKRQGAWKVMAWVLGLAQVMVGYGVASILSDLKDIHTELRVSALADEKISARIDVLEAKK